MPCATRADLSAPAVRTLPSYPDLRYHLRQESHRGAGYDMEYHISLHALSLRREAPRRATLTLRVRQTSVDPYLVRTERGPLGGKLHAQERGFDGMTAATAHMREIVQALLHSGFSVITMSQNHPLREWLASEVVVDDPHTRPQPVQLEFPQPQSGKRGEPAKAFTAEQLSLF